MDYLEIMIKELTLIRDKYNFGLLTNLEVKEQTAAILQFYSLYLK